MFGSIFDGTAIPVTQEMIAFAEARHQLLAGNIANLDTPDYQARDLSLDRFQTELKKAIAAAREARHPVTPGVGRQEQDPLRGVKDSMQDILFHDGSNIGAEQQITEMAKNQFMHNLGISIMNSQFRLLQAAISERV